MGVVAIDTFFSARALMGLSLVFHTFFTPIGIGMPLLLFIAEGLGLKTGDPRYRRLPPSRAPGLGFPFSGGGGLGPPLPAARPKLDSGRWSPVRGGGRFGHRTFVRTGPTLAGVHGLCRRHHWNAVFSGGICFLHGGDLSRDLYLRLGSPFTPGALAHEHSALRERGHLGCVRHRRERLDE